MQSGAHRKSFNIGPCPEGVQTNYRPPPGKQRSEERSVTGLATDSLNRVAIAATLDGTVNVRVRTLARQRASLGSVPTNSFSTSTRRNWSTPSSCLPPSSRLLSSETAVYLP